MARFLLIHGAAHGAWCWRDVIPALAAHGHAATAIDLPGHGADTTPLAEVTLERYADAVLGALDAPVTPGAPEAPMTPGAADAPAIVVGHSMGGYPITAAAARAPGRFARLVYLAAYLPWPGLSLAQMRMEAPRQPLLPAIRRHDDGIAMHFDPDMARDVFYHDCDDATVAWAKAHLCDQPLAPMQTPAPPGPPDGAVPRSYIVCTDDRAIPPEFQETMAAALPPRDVHRLDASHSPFLSRPQELADLLHRIAG